MVNLFSSPFALCTLSCAAVLGACSEPRVELIPASAVPRPVAIETLACSEVQVFPRLQGTELTRRYRKPGTKLQLRRFDQSFELTAPEGTISGRTQPTNDYVPEQTEQLKTEQKLTFGLDSYVVHCMPEPIDPPR
jgi:hypothetical protein